VAAARNTGGPLTDRDYDDARAVLRRIGDGAITARAGTTSPARLGDHTSPDYDPNRIIRILTALQYLIPTEVKEWAGHITPARARQRWEEFLFAEDCRRCPHDCDGCQAWADALGYLRTGEPGNRTWQRKDQAAARSQEPRMDVYIPPSVAPEDEFYSFGHELDLGDWAYILDDVGIVYGPGWYPFHRMPERADTQATGSHAGRAAQAAPTTPTGVRISPDLEPRAWGNEYVLLEPYDHRVQARMTLFVARRGMGVTVRRLSLKIDLRQRQVSLPDACPDALRSQAETKGGRVLDLLIAARRERRRGATAPGDVLGHREPARAHHGGSPA